MLDAKFPGPLEEPVHRRAIEPSRATEAVRLGDARQELEVHLLGETTEGAVGHWCRRLPEHARLQMMGNDSQNLRADVVPVDRVDVQAVEHRRGRGDTGLLVIDRADASVQERRREWLPEIVTDGAEHDCDPARAVQVIDAGARLVDHHQRVHPHVPFGVPLRFLLASDEGFDLRKEAVDDEEVESQGKTNRGARREEQ